MTFVVTFLLDESERVADDMQRIRVGDSVFRIVLARGPGELHNVNSGLTSGGCQGGVDGCFQYGRAVRRLCQEVWPFLFPFGEIGAAITTGAVAGGHQAISAGPESGSRALAATGHHGHNNAVSVEPGQTATMLLTFDASGEWGMACLEPGHFEGGMKGVVDVAPII